MSKKIDELTSDDVVSLKNDDIITSRNNTFKVSNFIQSLEEKINHQFNHEEDKIIETLINEGIDGEVLSPGQEWKKGRVKLSLILCSDEIESSRHNITEGKKKNKPYQIIDTNTNSNLRVIGPNPE
ncbi:MAG: hypothetical protein F6K10_25910 [Moorea sp. SIO2B7]|nr:hypothetical protein [Moorena sp. SIO2B7]